MDAYLIMHFPMVNPHPLTMSTTISNNSANAIKLFYKMAKLISHRTNHARTLHGVRDAAAKNPCCNEMIVYARS